MAVIPENVQVSMDNIHIIDSYNVQKKEFDDYLMEAYIQMPNNLVQQNRSDCSLKLEWATHNFLYNLHIARSRTKDVDLNYPQKWYCKVGYAICGCIGWIFIK